jgi:cell division protease FtsH
MEPKNTDENKTKTRRKRSDGDGGEERPRGSGNLIYLLLFFVGAIAIIAGFQQYYGRVKVITSFFEKQLVGKEYNGKPILDEDGNPIKCNIESITFKEFRAEGTFRVLPLKELTESEVKKLDGDHPKLARKSFWVGLDPAGNGKDREKFQDILKKAGVAYDVDSEPSNAFPYLLTFIMLLPVVLLLYFWYASRRAQDSMLGGGGFMSSFSRSPAQRNVEDSNKIVFSDVAGLEGVKADLQEIVEYLREPEKFQRLGGQVPTGVLLNGPPGTGKTLLARAIAGEADVPFYSVNGSEFIQMFVGVGASRVRDLFKQAKETSPAIIFIDEIDAVGRQRGAGLGGGNDEREQTLNQILGEMDGFSQTDSVIVVGATNRPDVLDPALLRPGRFDRHITVNRPSKKGRLAIFKVHVRNVPLADDVDLEILASSCIGMTGADIRNVVNEAALWAARNDKSVVSRSDFNYVVDKVRMGSLREEVLSDEEKEKTAYHEAGHTITGWFLEGADPVQKVTVIPRGQALGVTMSIPEEERLSYSEQSLRDRLVMLLGGRAAELIIYNELLAGAQSDIERATSIARKMVMDLGMSKRMGPVSFKTADEDPFLGRELHQQRNFSERTMEMIDEEVSKLIQESMDRAVELLKEHREKLDELTKQLIENEELEAHEIEEVLGPSIHKTKPDWVSVFGTDVDFSKSKDSKDSDSKNSDSNSDKPVEPLDSESSVVSNDSKSEATEA